MPTNVRKMIRVCCLIFRYNTNWNNSRLILSCWFSILLFNMFFSLLSSIFKILFHVTLIIILFNFTLNRSSLLKLRAIIHALPWNCIQIWSKSWWLWICILLIVFSFNSDISFLIKTTGCNPITVSLSRLLFFLFRTFRLSKVIFFDIILKSSFSIK